MTYLDAEALELYLETSVKLLKRDTEAKSRKIRILAQAKHSALTQVLNNLSKFVVTETPQVPIQEIKRPVKESVRRNDPDTSWEAALSITPEKRISLYRNIYETLSRDAMTDDEISLALRIRSIHHSGSGLRTRRSELVRAGWVRATSEKRLSDNGHPSTVWEAIPEHAGSDNSDA